MSEKSVAYSKLDQLALKLVIKLRGRRAEMFVSDGGGVATYVNHERFDRLCRESVRHSLLMEFDDIAHPEESDDIAHYRNIAVVYGPAIDEWIESHIDLIGEASFSEDGS